MTVPGMEDRLAIRDRLAVYGHVLDNHRWDEVGDIFAAEAVYDNSRVTGMVIHGGAELAAHWARTYAAQDHVIAHHVTNIMIGEAGEGGVPVASKGVIVTRNGRCSSFLYEDVFRLTGSGWRIVHRRVSWLKDAPGTNA